MSVGNFTDFVSDSSTFDESIGAIDLTIDLISGSLDGLTGAPFDH